jgi:hypothetical protein
VNGMAAPLAKMCGLLLSCRCCSCSHPEPCWACLPAGAAIRQAQQQAGGHCSGGAAGSPAAGAAHGVVGWLVHMLMSF